jgi:hypothetical protein
MGHDGVAWALHVTKHVSCIRESTSSPGPVHVLPSANLQSHFGFDTGVMIFRDGGAVPIVDRK